VARARWLGAHGLEPEGFAPLWIGLKGNAMTGSGIRQMVWKRSEAVGERIHPHQLRHLFASEWLRAGKSESGLMELGGWASRAMIDSVYARGNRAERAIEEHLRD
jgi:integrase